MAGRIFALRDDGALAPMAETPYELEDVLQRLLADHPDLLQLDQADGSPWLLVTREASIPGDRSGAERFAVDHLFLDRDGVPTLVEVKRSTDTRLRREVVGQILDYAANAVVYWPADAIRQRFEVRCEAEGRDPDETLAEFLGEGDVEVYWERVRTNLQAERIRMILVADEIPRETQRIIEFLNGQLDPAEILGVQIRQFVGEGITTLVPRVLGRTAEAEQRKTTPRATRRWDAGSFDRELAGTRGEEELRLAREIRTWAADRDLLIDWGRGARIGSFMPKLDRDGRLHGMFSVGTNGEVQLSLGSMQRPPFDQLDKRRELVERLNDIPGVELRVENLATGWPVMPLRPLGDGECLTRFLDVWDWYLEQVR
jgi:hypothetical protein